MPHSVLSIFRTRRPTTLLTVVIFTVITYRVSVYTSLETQWLRENPIVPELKNRISRARLDSPSADHSLTLEASVAAPQVACSKVQELSCSRLFDGDMKEYESKKDKLQYLPHYNLNLTAFLESAHQSSQYCSEFKSQRGYAEKPQTEEEAEFPIAYSILVFKEVELFERLLHAIYRPQNVYCVHVDKSADLHVHRSVEAIIKCFDNVFAPTQQVDVEYTKFSSLEADLICMRELLKYKKWKYLINLTGQEFPLQTSMGIVKILKALNGSNSIEGILNHGNRDRYVNAGALPVTGVVLTKGAVHIAAKRAFIEYALTNNTALKFLEWVAKTEEPDETYFSSLNHSPKLGVPGAYLGYPNSKRPGYPFLARFKNWIDVPDLPCKGKYVRSVCVMAAGDLRLIASRMELFVNKFNMDYDPIAYVCMEELLCNRTREELSGARSVNISYYTQFEFTWNHLR